MRAVRLATRLTESYTRIAKTADHLVFGPLQISIADCSWFQGPLPHSVSHEFRSMNSILNRFIGAYKRIVRKLAGWLLGPSLSLAGKVWENARQDTPYAPA